MDGNDIRMLQLGHDPGLPNEANMLLELAIEFRVKLFHGDATAKVGVDATNYRAAIELLESGSYPFADLPRQTAGLDEIESLVKTMAGETDHPAPIHAVFTP